MEQKYQEFKAYIRNLIGDKVVEERRTKDVCLYHHGGKRYLTYGIYSVLSLLCEQINTSVMNDFDVITEKTRDILEVEARDYMQNVLKNRVCSHGFSIHSQSSTNAKRSRHCQSSFCQERNRTLSKQIEDVKLQELTVDRPILMRANDWVSVRKGEIEIIDDLTIDID